MKGTTIVKRKLVKPLKLSFSIYCLQKQAYETTSVGINVLYNVKSFARKSRAYLKSYEVQKQNVARRKCRTSHAKFCTTFYECDFFLAQNIRV